MDILEGLNPEQLVAVNHDIGPQLVIAGAGTGKTQVITRRIAHLIETGRAKPMQILALTFTEKAAREMEERLYELIGWESFQVPVMTFNAFGAGLLGRFASHIGRSTRGGLLNDTQKTLILQQHLSEIKMHYYGPQDDYFEFSKSVVNYIGKLQNAGVTPEAYEAYVDGLFAHPGEMHPSEIQEQADLVALFKLYEKLKVESGAYDYNDQLSLPLQIIKARSNLADRLGAEYKYVLVDEYQDTNSIQDELLRSFIARGGNIFAVGDDDQAIYGFRGADINNILAFAEHFDVSEPAVLIRNYRSGQQILDSSYRLIQHNNPMRLESRLEISKRLIAQHHDSEVGFTPYMNAMAEINGVIDQIEKDLSAGMPADEIAVLAATHAPLKAMAKAMARRGVPYAISTSISIFEQPELLALWYLIKWLSWQATDEAICHVIVGPFIGWSPENLRPVIEASRRDLMSVEQAIRVSTDERCMALAKQLDEWRQWLGETPVSQLCFKLIFDTGLAERWQKQAESNPRMIRVFEDLHRLLEQMQDFETVAISPYLKAYLAAFPKPPALEVSEPAGDLGGVQLLTVHAAKGLEFEGVYLINCTQRSWSAGRALGREIPEGLRKQAADLPAEHEFRRLMYVAVTRGKRWLRISAPVASVGGMRQIISPFISEIFGAQNFLHEPVVASGGAAKEDILLTKLQRFYPLNAIDPNPKLPFEDDEGWLDLSVTALGQYDFCPFEFYLQQVLRISQPMGPQLGFGNALHRVFELYYKSRLSNNILSLDDLHRALDELWTERGYSDRGAADVDRDLAHKTLSKFFDREEKVQRPVVGSEVPIRLDVPEARLRIRGKIDALFRRSDGLEVRDFKTGRNKTSAEKLSKQAKTNFQLRSYALALAQLKGEVPVAVVLDYVVTNVEGEAEITKAILKNHLEKLKAMTDRIRSRDFAPNASAMHECAAIRFYGTGEQEELLAGEQATGGAE